MFFLFFPPPLFFFFEKNEKCLELPDLARKLIEIIFWKFYRTPPPTTSVTALHFFCFCFSGWKNKSGEELNKFQSIFWSIYSQNQAILNTFNFFLFFQKKINCGHYFCLLSTKIVDTLFPAISVTHQGCACT